MSGRGRSVGLHLLANGLVWLCLAAVQDAQQAQLLQALLRLPKTHAVSTATSLLPSAL